MISMGWGIHRLESPCSPAVRHLAPKQPTGPKVRSTIYSIAAGQTIFFRVRLTGDPLTICQGRSTS